MSWRVHRNKFVAHSDSLANLFWNRTTISRALLQEMCCWGGSLLFSFQPFIDTGTLPSFTLFCSFLLNTSKMALNVLECLCTTEWVCPKHVYKNCSRSKQFCHNFTCSLNIVLNSRFVRSRQGPFSMHQQIVLFPARKVHARQNQHWAMIFPEPNFFACSATRVVLSLEW